MSSDDDQTRLIRRSGGHEAGGDAPTRKIAKGANPEDTVPTRQVGGTRRIETTDDRTVILGPSTRRRSSDSGAEQEVADRMYDPVVGWLAIVSGPGAGDFVRMGYGMNAIGRAEDQRCRLAFGDEKISRQNHATITYDPRGRKFFIQHGGGQNLTYVNDSPVLQPAELKGGEFIVIGNTVLRFVPLCGADFDYPDAPSQPSVA
jgi:hypothetical protein